MSSTWEQEQASGQWTSPISFPRLKWLGQISQISPVPSTIREMLCPAPDFQPVATCIRIPPTCRPPAWAAGVCGSPVVRQAARSLCGSWDNLSLYPCGGVLLSRGDMADRTLVYYLCCWSPIAEEECEDIRRNPLNQWRTIGLNLSETKRYNEMAAQTKSSYLL